MLASCRAERLVFSFGHPRLANEGRLCGKLGRSHYSEQMTKLLDSCRVDEGRKRVIGIMAAILASLHMQTADDLFGGPQGSPRTDKLIAASIQWAEKIMEKIDNRCSDRENRA